MLPRELLVGFVFKLWCICGLGNDLKNENGFGKITCEICSFSTIALLKQLYLFSNEITISLFHIIRTWMTLSNNHKYQKMMWLIGRWYIYPHLPAFVFMSQNFVVCNISSHFVVILSTNFKIHYLQFPRKFACHLMVSCCWQVYYFVATLMCQLFISGSHFGFEFLTKCSEYFYIAVVQWLQL